MPVQSLAETFQKIRLRLEQSTHGHSSPSEAVEEVIECSRCQDRGWLSTNVDVKDPTFGQVYRCPCQEEGDTRNFRERFAQSLPDGMSDRTFDNFRLRPNLSTHHRQQLAEAVVACKLFATQETSYKWVTLAGSGGWGKTHLAVAILQERNRIEAGPMGRFGFCPDILKEIQAGFHDDTDQLVMEGYKNAGLLVLDDLGTEYHKQNDDGLSWAEEQLLRLLDHRYREALPTIITTNTPADKMNFRLADRILDTGTGLVKVFSHSLPSYRTGKVLM